MTGKLALKLYYPDRVIPEGRVLLIIIVKFDETLPPKRPVQDRIILVPIFPSSPRETKHIFVITVVETASAAAFTLRGALRTKIENGTGRASLGPLRLAIANFNSGNQDF